MKDHAYDPGEPRMNLPGRTLAAAAERLHAVLPHGSGSEGAGRRTRYRARQVLEAACDPALGIDRLVPVADVVEALRGAGAFNCGPYRGYEYADELVRSKFGGKA